MNSTNVSDNGKHAMMTPEQRYLFDVTGYLHLENALNAAELRAAQDAAERYINTPPEELPPGFQVGGKGYANGFAFDKALEALTMHPVRWPIIKELTSNRPQLHRGTMMVDHPGAPEPEKPGV